MTNPLPSSPPFLLRLEKWGLFPEVTDRKFDDSHVTNLIISFLISFPGYAPAFQGTVSTPIGRGMLPSHTVTTLSQNFFFVHYAGISVVKCQEYERRNFIQYVGTLISLPPASQSEPTAKCNRAFQH